MPCVQAPAPLYEGDLGTENTALKVTPAVGIPVRPGSPVHLQRGPPKSSFGRERLFLVKIYQAIKSAASGEIPFKQLQNGLDLVAMAMH